MADSTQDRSGWSIDAQGNFFLNAVKKFYRNRGQNDIVCGVNVITQTFTRAGMTDGGAAVGTAVFTDSLPVGAIILGMRIVPTVGFIGDTSAVITVGDGSDPDRYMTGTPNVFVAAPSGVDAGVPSGIKTVLTANAPTLTLTSATDFTNVSGGSVTITIFYLET